MFYIGRIVGKGDINKPELIRILQSPEMERLCLDIAKRMISEDRHRIYYQIKTVKPVGIKGFAPDRVAAEIGVNPSTPTNIKMAIAREQSFKIMVGKKFRKEISNRKRYIPVTNDKRKNRPKRGA